jgi:hypothetical protein
LARHPCVKPEGEATRIVAEKAMMLVLKPCGAWKRVHLAVKRDDGMGFDQIGSVYYRQTQDGHFLSDCGESLTGIMLRTGCTWAQAHQRIATVVDDSTIFFGHSSQGEIGYGIDGHKHSDDLPTAIIRILRAVAACAEVGK